MASPAVWRDVEALDAQRRQGRRAAPRPVPGRAPRPARACAPAASPPRPAGAPAAGSQPSDRHVEPGAALLARLVLPADLAAGLLRQRLDQQPARDRVAGAPAAAAVGAEVVLRDEGVEHAPPPAATAGRPRPRSPWPVSAGSSAEAVASARPRRAPESRARSPRCRPPRTIARLTQARPPCTLTARMSTSRSSQVVHRLLLQHAATAWRSGCAARRPFVLEALGVRPSCAACRPSITCWVSPPRKRIGLRTSRA